MGFDDEDYGNPRGEHDECAREIHRLEAELAEAKAERARYGDTVALKLYDAFQVRDAIDGGLDGFVFEVPTADIRVTPDGKVTFRLRPGDCRHRLMSCILAALRPKRPAPPTEGGE